MKQKDKSSLFKRLAAACNRAIFFSRRNMFTPAQKKVARIPRPKNRLNFGVSLTRFGRLHEGVSRRDFMQEFCARSATEANFNAAIRRENRAARKEAVAAC